MLGRRTPYRKREGFCRIWSVLGSVLLLAAVVVLRADAQTARSAQNAQNAEPYLVERKQIGDPRSRFELRFGEARDKCTAWRLETIGRPDGYAVLEVKEPADRTVLLEAQMSQQHLELIVGDDACSYRVRIERNK